MREAIEAQIRNAKEWMAKVSLRGLMVWMAKHVKEFAFCSSWILIIAGVLLVVYGFCKMGDGGSEYFALVVGGFTLMNALIQLTNSIRDEQTKYGYQMVSDWHDLIAKLNSEGSSFFNSSRIQYDDVKTTDSVKKRIGDDFQRLIDQMNVILWSIEFDVNVSINDLRKGWIETFRKTVPDKEFAGYLWNEKGYKNTIPKESRGDFEDIFV